MIDFAQFGGVAINPKSCKALDPQETADAIHDPESVLWNFGVDLSHPQRLDMNPEVWAAHQASESDRIMTGLPLREWDGKTTTKRMAMTKQILHHGKPGTFLPAQYQPRGTCVGRGASGAINNFQAVLCMMGFPMIWKPVSHAWCYAGARMQYGDLGGGDGAVGKGAFEWCRAKGVCHQEEAGDTDYYKDAVAVQWASRGIPTSIVDMGRDNPLTEAFSVTSAKKAADVLFSGGGVTVASNRGFAQRRDADGVDKPSGNWAHQMHFVDICVTPTGRKVFACVQSWGEDGGGITGPLLSDQPAYVFGVEWDVADSMLRVGDSMGCMNFEGWLSKLVWGA